MSGPMNCSTLPSDADRIARSEQLVAADRGAVAEARSLHGRRPACVEAGRAATSVQESNLLVPMGVA